MTGAARPSARDRSRRPGADPLRGGPVSRAAPLPRTFHRRPTTAPMTRVAIYDTTLRDGSQGEGVNFSLQDKLLLTKKLDELGIDYIEGGYPLSNPKDFEYFQAVRGLKLKHAKVAAFGMTRRKNAPAETDTCLKALLDAKTPVVTIVGKTWDFHVTNVLSTTLEENAAMIADSV